MSNELKIILTLLLCFAIIIFFVVIVCIFESKHRKNKSKKEKDVLIQEIQELITKKEKLSSEILEKNQELNNIISNETACILNKIHSLKDNELYAHDQYIATLEQDYNKAEQEYYFKIDKLNQQEESFKTSIQEYKNQIEELKDKLNAGTRAQLRNREKEEQLNFYRLSVSESDLKDIQKLNEIKDFLRNPEVVSKVIWTSYFQKQATDMCNRILGTSIVCGIYKITNINTQQCYIGQSLDVAKRFKEHIKCGLGIGASATNKLYSAMNKEGVWNFTFELLESCDAHQLNERESFWISMYEAYEYGYNSNKGIVKENK